MSKYTYLFAGVVIGMMFGAFFVPLELIDASIPPTRAFPFINVTLPWADSGSFMVESDSSMGNWTLISDGSMYFNVTEAPIP